MNAVLASLRGRNENPKVLSYLTHWESVDPVSAAKARSSFISNLEKRNKMAFSAVCSFRRELDRLDLAQYMLSGEIRVSAGVGELVEKEAPGGVGTKPNTAEAGKTETGQTKASKRRNRKKNKKKPVSSGTVPTPSSAPLVGNVTMWNVPPGSPPLRDDIALNTVEFTELLDDYIEREKQQEHSCDRLSVVDLFIIRTMKNLSRLRGLMLRDKLTIEVNYGVVKAVKGEDANDPVNKNLLARIARIRPRTMSWSSLLDNFLPEEFHDIARRCSMYSTCVHSGYCMQGPTCSVLQLRTLIRRLTSPRSMLCWIRALDSRTSRCQRLIYPWTPCSRKQGWTNWCLCPSASTHTTARRSLSRNGMVKTGSITL